MHSSSLTYVKNTKVKKKKLTITKKIKLLKQTGIIQKHFLFLFFLSYVIYT